MFPPCVAEPHYRSHRKKKKSPLPPRASLTVKHSERPLLVPDLLLDLLDAPLERDDLLVDAGLLPLQRGQLLLEAHVLAALQVGLHSELLLHALHVRLEVPLDVGELRLQPVGGGEVLGLDGLQLGCCKQCCVRARCLPILCGLGLGFVV